MPRSVIQLTPDVKYTIAPTSSVRNVESAIAVTGGQGIGTLTPMTEYWSLTPDFMAALGRATAGSQVTLNGEKLALPLAGFPVAGAYPTFTTPASAEWIATPAPLDANLWLGQGTNDSTVGVDFEDLVPPTSSTEPWRGSMTWYVATRSGEAPVEPVIGPDTTILTYSTVTRSGGELRWFSVRLEPAQVSER